MFSQKQTLQEYEQDHHEDAESIWCIEPWTQDTQQLHPKHTADSHTCKVSLHHEQASNNNNSKYNNVRIAIVIFKFILQTKNKAGFAK